MFLRCSCSGEIETMCERCKVDLCLLIEQSFAEFDNKIPGYGLRLGPECLDCNDTGIAVVYGGSARPCHCDKSEKY